MKEEGRGFYCIQFEGVALSQGWSLKIKTRNSSKSHIREIATLKNFPLYGMNIDLTIIYSVRYKTCANKNFPLYMRLLLVYPCSEPKSITIFAWGLNMCLEIPSYVHVESHPQWHTCKWHCVKVMMQRVKYAHTFYKANSNSFFRIYSPMRHCTGISIVWKNPLWSAHNSYLSVSEQYEPLQGSYCSLTDR